MNPSAFIPFCGIGLNMSSMGLLINQFSFPICRSFRAKVFKDQLCYELNPNIKEGDKVGIHLLGKYSGSVKSITIFTGRIILISSSPRSATSSSPRFAPSPSTAPAPDSDAASASPSKSSSKRFSQSSLASHLWISV